MQNSAFFIPVAHVWATAVFLGDWGGGMRMKRMVIILSSLSASGADEGRCEE